MEKSFLQFCCWPFSQCTVGYVACYSIRTIYQKIVRGTQLPVGKSTSIGLGLLMAMG